MGVDWREVLPAYYACVARSAPPDEYARAVKEVVDFVAFDSECHLKEARAVASPAQKKALREASRRASKRGSREGR